MSLINIISVLAGRSSTAGIPVTDLSNCIIVCDGNSLTQGYLASSPAAAYPAVLGTLAPLNTNGATIYNVSVGGQKTSAMLADASTDVDTKKVIGRTNICVAWEIGNELRLDNGVPANAAICYNNFVSYCQGRKSAGFKVVALTVPFRGAGVGWNGNWWSDAQSINAQMRAEYLSYADALVDVAAESLFQSYNATYYNADQIHFTDAGYAKVAELVRDAITSL